MKIGFKTVIFSAISLLFFTNNVFAATNLDSACTKQGGFCEMQNSALKTGKSCTTKSKQLGKIKTGLCKSNNSSKYLCCIPDSNPNPEKTTTPTKSTTTKTQSSSNLQCSVKISPESKKCKYEDDWGVKNCYMGSLDQGSTFNIKGWISDPNIDKKIKIGSMEFNANYASGSVIGISGCSYDGKSVNCNSKTSDGEYPKITLEGYENNKLVVSCTFNDGLIHSTNFNMNLSPFALTKKVNNTGTMESNVKLVFSFIFKWFYTIFGFLAGVIILVGGVMMITSFGNQEKFNKGKNAVTYTAIALAVSILAYPIITLIQGLLK